MTQEVTEERIFRLAIYAIASCFVILVLTIGGCTMHSNAYEPDVAREEAGQKLAELEIKKIAVEAEAAKIAVLKGLIESGINPVSARCGVMGWDTKDPGSESICNAAVLK